MNSLDLVRIIGLSDKACAYDNFYEDENFFELFPLSIKNKIPLLYLESVKGLCKNCDELKKSYVQLKRKEEAILFLMEKIVNTLSRYDINYVVFKTLRPFPFIASDIDLLFFTDEETKKALEGFTASGCKLIGSGPRNFTMLDLESGIKIDLYSEITVSNIIYMDKNKLKEYVTETTTNKVQMPVPTPEADLLVTIGHSFYKEQLYTLADFYAITLRLTQFTSNQRGTFIELAKALHMKYACSLLLQLTQTIHSIVFGTEIREIAEISSKLQLNSLLYTATYRGLKPFVKKLKLPLKYNYKTVAIGLADKILKDKNARHSILYQVKESLVNTQFLKEFMRQLVVHIIRETY